MCCSNNCTCFNLSEISQTMFAGYARSSFKAGFGPYSPLADQQREHHQREKANESYQVSVAASTAHYNLQQDVTQAQQIADPMLSGVLAGLIVGTAVFDALTNMLAGKRANED